MYQKGQGVAKDHAEALKWLKKAYEQGYGTDLVAVGTESHESDEGRTDAGDAGESHPSDAGNPGATDAYPVVLYIFRDGVGLMKIASVPGERQRVSSGKKISAEEAEHFYFLPQSKFAPGIVNLR